MQFLSTPSARRATWRSLLSAARAKHFYPRPPRGGRRARQTLRAHRRAISIHALREEGDATVPHKETKTTEFLSTPSARRATCGVMLTFNVTENFYPRPPRGGRQFVVVVAAFCISISIHALREEGDLAELLYPPPWLISIHALREEGDKLSTKVSTSKLTISIHALREEGDEHHDASRTNLGHFYPRPPRGGRHCHRAPAVHSISISIHALREEGD